MEWKHTLSSLRIRSAKGETAWAMTYEETAMNGWYTGGTAPSEQQLREEIAFYERKCAALAGEAGGDDDGVRFLYAAHALHRKKLLAAVRDGRPEAWLEYRV